MSVKGIQFQLFLISFLLSSYLIQGEVVNVVNAPIINGRKLIKVKKFAQVPPDSFGTTAKITGITRFGKSLYVVSSIERVIYRIDQFGKVIRWANIESATKKGTGRSINIDERVHGGLRSIAFHPTFWTTGLFYVSAIEDRPSNEAKFRYFSKPGKIFGRATGDSVVLEFRFDLKLGKLDTSSYRQVLRVGIPRFDHAMKQMIFVGKNLIIGHGDGSFVSAIAGTGQLNDGLGKLFRIDPRKNGNLPYSIPPTNPYIGNPRYRNELYAVGFRSPHNLCHSKRFGLFVVDIGRDNVEEVNIVQAGRNYGWSMREGTFVHLVQGKTKTGVQPLPKDDSKLKLSYPNVIVGHRAEVGSTANGIALAGSCPIENGSELAGLYLYCNFPSGEIYYSFLQEMRTAVTMGPPNSLTQARTYRAKVLYDHDSNAATPPLKLNNLLDVVRTDLKKKVLRVDVRFGMGFNGEIYFSSKTNGMVYIITSTLKPKKI